MRKLNFLLTLCLLFAFAASVNSQTFVRKRVEVPKVDSGAIKIDGKMNEAAWQTAAHADILSSSGTEGQFNKYYAIGDKLTEPDYKSIYGRMLWSKDTLYLFYHVQEIKTDSTGLFFGKPFEADQVFVGLSNRLGVEKLEGSYNGAPYAAPNGPYHFFILGPKVTLNGGDSTHIPPEYQRFPGDTVRAFKASDIARWATTIDTNTATYDIEMAIYNPDINAQSVIGFNLGGSQGSRVVMDPSSGDRTYSYYSWQPNVPNDPYKNPGDQGDPGAYSLVTSKYWALLNFVSKTTGVEDSKLSNKAPGKYDLSQNYPNPFNPTTSIRFDVPHFGPVTLKVYNVVGQLVATLVNNRELSPGTYSVTWNAGALSSGVYLYSLEAGGVTVTKKMVLLK